MKTTIHKQNERGVGEHGWLHTRYSFSFADWYNPARMGFGKLLVINDDVIEPGQGFGMHAHRNMEIITIVTEGTVAHKDSMGSDFVVPAGDVQIMSAGSGVMHSEYNDSSIDRLALFQIWIEPDVQNLEPHYAQKAFGLATSQNKLELLCAPLGNDGTLLINQDAFVSYGKFEAGKQFEYKLHSPKHGVYVFVIEGLISVGGEDLWQRDAMGIEEAEVIDIDCKETSKILIFEVPM